MLEKVRKPERAKSFIAYLIFGAICLVFVFMGDIPNQFGMSVGGPAAMVNKEPIPFSDFREIYSRLQNMNKRRLDFLPAAQRKMFLDNMKSDALELLIEKKLVTQAALDMGLYISDEEIRDYIVKIPAFNEDEKFQRERYDNYLAYRKMTAEKFENEIRGDVSNTQVRNLMQMALTPSEVSVGYDLELGKIKLNLSYAKVANSAFENSVKASKDEVAAYIADENNAQKLKDYYNANKSNYEEEEQVKARHILVKFDDAKADEKTQAEAKIKEIQAKLASEDFAKLAKEYSDDPGSKAKGGDLGFFPRGAMVPEFEKVAFSAELNKVSEPVKTSFGFHLIKVEEKKAASSKTFDEAKELVAEELVKEDKIEKAKAELKTLVAEGQKKKSECLVKEKQLKVGRDGGISVELSENS